MKIEPGELFHFNQTKSFFIRLLLREEAGEYVSLKICEYNVTLKSFNEGSKDGTISYDTIEDWSDPAHFTAPVALEPKLRKELWEVLDKGYLIMKIFGEKVIMWRPKEYLGRR